MVIIPSDQLSITEKARKRQEAVERGIDRAVKKLGVLRTELTYRHAQNIVDFGTLQEQWLTATLVLIYTPYSVWAGPAGPLVVYNPLLANNKVAVFYSAAILAPAPNPVSLLSFRKGAAAGTTLAVFDLEQIEAQLILEGYFSLPIAYDPQDVLNVVVTSKVATGFQAAIALGCYIIEPVGTTIS